jgi:hypothetical protein
MTFFGILLIFWVFLMLMQSVFGDFSLDRPEATARYVLTAVLGIYLPMIWLGLKTIRRRPWALWGGFCVAILEVCVMVSELFFGFPIIDCVLPATLPE